MTTSVQSGSSPGTCHAPLVPTNVKTMRTEARNRLDADRNAATMRVSVAQRSVQQPQQLGRAVEGQQRRGRNEHRRTGDDHGVDERADAREMQPSLHGDQ